MTWRNTNGDNAYGYTLQRKSANGRWEFQHYLFHPRQEFVDGSVIPQTTYSYRIYAYNTQKDNVESFAWSRTATVTTPPRVEAPGPLSLTRWIIPTTANSP